MLAHRQHVPFKEGTAYQNAAGAWKVLVVIDNANQVERPATEAEIAAAQAPPVEDAADAKPAGKKKA